ncbi:MAG: TIGR00725 family protein [Methanomassiliicoccales archaeon]|nr:MAG: TIGR00725 family protein [Methanomassiliicoccales archaeon]
MKNKPLIAVCGDTRLQHNDRRTILAEKLGNELIHANYRIVTGGLGGVMEAVCRGAKQSKEYQEGDIVGILPGFDPNEANKYIDIKLATGLDNLRNQIVANSDAVVVIGGGAGTLSEIAFAWMLKRLIIAYEVEGWSGKLANTKLDNRIRYENIKDDKIYGVKSEEEVIDILNQLLPLYTRRHHGVRNIK